MTGKFELDLGSTHLPLNVFSDLLQRAKTAVSLCGACSQALEAGSPSWGTGRAPRTCKRTPVHNITDRPTTDRPVADRGIAELVVELALAAGDRPAFRMAFEQPRGSPPGRLNRRIGRVSLQ
jgi:hypothetical protein